MAKNFYVTTPIYYVNDKPHIGHAYTTIACDAISRYKRLKGFDVKFLTGTDEHGQKIERAAQNFHKTPQELVDEIHVKFKDLWKTLNISNDDFIRTTEPRHIKTVQEIFSRLLAKGDIYKGKYEGFYCVSCENYVSESNMAADKTCPDCGAKLINMQEESYFFRASKYVPDLIKFYEANPNAIKPATRYNEIMSFLRGGVKDISVSRTSLKWGIPVPGDENHVIYVWFDALINYLSALNFPDGEDFAKFWPNSYHVVGKDIIRFHCVTWPLILLALGEKLPAGIIAHGWWTIKGGKMSKSKGNVIDPLDMIHKYGLDPFRYFLLREVPFGSDGEFSEDALIGRINSDLANDLGNLLNRTLQMIKNYRDGVVPSYNDANSPLRELAQTTITKVDDFMNDFAFDSALKAIWEFISRSNKFIDETTPWILAKNNESDKLDYVLLNLYEALRLCAVLISPFMPVTSEKICEQLGCELKISEWGAGSGNKINKGEILFPRIDLKKETQKMSESQAVQEPEQSSQITIEDFAKIEMRVGQITGCEEIPRSKKLYKLTVDLGSEVRTVCSGIKEYFKPEDLTGKKIILVCNLKPVKLCGVDSNGMILAASVKSEGKLTLLTPLDENIPLGSVVS